MGRNGPGTRGTHDSPASPNMPAKMPRRQGDFSGSGKGGVHDSGPPGRNNVKPQPDFRPSVGHSTQPLRGGSHLKANMSDPRRSHS